MKNIKIGFYLAVAMITYRANGSDAPNIADLILYKPTIQSNFGETHEAGTAFVMKYEASRYLITAHHLFGPSGGFSKEMTPAQIASEITSIQLRNVITGEEIQAGPNVQISGAKTTSLNNAANRDIAVFQMDLTVGGLTLSARTPKQGDFVWLVAPSKDNEDTKLIHSAVILYVSEGTVFYKFDNTRIDLRSTSGAPVIDEDGNVVAINTAAIPIPLMPKIGIGGTVNYLKEQIELARNNRSKN
jgi:hypothetical protein